MPAEQAEPATTWDGLRIATDEPIGSSVAARRRTSEGAVEVLVLHRSVNGPEYEGDWAWTGPAGCRQPGEAVYPAALRELAEEAGLRHLRPWAVDLSGHWALFAVDVPDDVAVDLVDPEHDRFEWLELPAVAARVLPPVVADGQARAAAVPAVEIGFRPVTDADFAAIAAWHRAPHVREWWDSHSLDEDSARRRYTPRLTGEEPTRMWVIEIDGAAAGTIQDYRVGDDTEYAERTGYPDAVAFDYLIGEKCLVGRGIGTRMIWEFCRDVLLRDYPDAEHFLASPSYRNARSLRVLAKCGFSAGRRIPGSPEPGEPGDDEIVCTLDIAHWFGPRASACATHPAP